MQSLALAPFGTLASLLLGLSLAGCEAETSDGSASTTTMRDVATPHWPGAADQSGAPGTSAAGADAGGGGCTAGQRILPDELTNARDLGGTALTDGRHVACGQLLRGAPLRLSSVGCADFSELGVKSVVDLRNDSERASVPDAACITANVVAAPFPIPYGLSAEDYLRVLHESTALATAFHTFGDDSAYPVYFHCTYGRDRTGVIGALLLLALGASRETVMTEYLLSKPFVGAYPDALDAVLDEVESRGGVERVLQDAGITEAELATLRERAVSD